MTIDLATCYITFSTKGNTDIIDITSKVQAEIEKSSFYEGQATIFGIGSTTGLTTIEYEPGLVQTDMAAMYDRLAPYRVPYAHNDTWGDDNGAAHLRATLQGCSLVVPFESAQLILGTWQQIVFIDFDTRPRSRKVVVQLLGKKR